MIGEKISYYRKAKKLTQESLSKGICSISYLSKIENNKMEPSEEVLDFLCKRLDINKDELFEINDDFDHVFDEWKLAIFERNVEKAISIQKDLEEKKNVVQNLEFIINYSLLLFGHVVLVNNLIQAEEELPKLTKQFKLFTGEQTSLYYQFLGLFFYKKDKLPEALECFKKSEQVGEENHCIRPELLYHLALVYSRLFQIPFSITYAKKALQLFDQDSKYLRSLDCKILLGINNIRLGNFQEAEHYLQNTLKIATPIDNQKLRAIILHNIGFLYSAMKDHNNAISHYHESLSLGIDTKRKVNTIYYLAKEYFVLGERDTALDWCIKGIEEASKAQLDLYRIKMLLLRHQICGEEETCEYVEILEQQAIPYFQEKKDFIHISQYAEVLAEIYAKRLRYKKAYEYLEIANNARKKLNGVVIEL